MFFDSNVSQLRACVRYYRDHLRRGRAVRHIDSEEARISASLLKKRKQVSVDCYFTDSDDTSFVARFEKNHRAQKSTSDVAVVAPSGPEFVYDLTSFLVLQPPKRYRSISPCPRVAVPITATTTTTTTTFASTLALVRRVGAVGNEIKAVGNEIKAIDDRRRVQNEFWSHHGFAPGRFYSDSEHVPSFLTPAPQTSCERSCRSPEVSTDLSKPRESR